MRRVSRTAQSFAELEAKLRKGEKTQVIDSDQQKTEGKFDGVSDCSLGLIANGARQEFAETRILEVRKRRPESKWDGALIGLGVGAVTGLAQIRTHCNHASERDDCINVGMIFIWPIFAAAGAGSRVNRFRDQETRHRIRVGIHIALPAKALASAR